MPMVKVSNGGSEDITVVSTTFDNQGSTGSVGYVTTQVGDVVVVAEHTNSTGFYASVTGGTVMYRGGSSWGAYGVLAIKATSTKVSITQANSAATWGSYQYLVVLRCE